MATPLAERTVLHVGCGPRHPGALHETFRSPEWREVRLDVNPAVAPDIVGSMIDLGMIDTGAFDAVWSSHNLEHLFAHEVPRALSEFHRVLKPGGFALITLPDLQRVAELVVADRLEDVAYVSPAGPIMARDMIYGFGRAIAQGNHFMAHRTGFTAKSLGAALFGAGFSKGSVSRQGWDLWARAEK